MGVERKRRPPVAFLAWATQPGRAVGIADELGGEARCFNHPRLIRSAPVLLRYGMCTCETIAYLLRRRPRATIVTNPPILLGIIALLYGRLTGTPVLLDSHPGGFGAQGDVVSARLQTVHRWVAKRVSSVLVTTAHWVAVVHTWGGRAEIVHEPPPQWEITALPNRDEREKTRSRVLYVGIFAPDEPIAEVVAAAERLPDIDFLITGEIWKCPGEFRKTAPSNVTFCGFLQGGDYVQALEQADVVLALTTEPTSIMRAAYEAVYAQRPVVVSDWPDLRATFPYAQFVANDAESIARGIQQLVDDYESHVGIQPLALAAQRDRWRRQVAQLRSHIACHGYGYVKGDEERRSRRLEDPRGAIQ